MWNNITSAQYTTFVAFLCFIYWITLCIEPVILTGRIFNSTACNAPCKEGTFEVMPCADKHPKLCKGKLQHNFTLICNNVS